MKQETKQESEKGRIELCKEADRILKEAGLGIWGEENSSEKYRQDRFEDSMQNGAYGRNGSRRAR